MLSGTPNIILKEALLMFCPNCGKQCGNNAQFCDNCGTPFNAQQIPGTGYAPGHNAYKAPIKKRSVGLAIVLSLITCGIYKIYWFICLVDDLNDASGHPQDSSGGMVFLLNLVTCGIYGIFWIYKAGEKVSEIKRQSGTVDSNQALMYLLLWIFGFGIVDYALIQSELNKVAADA